MLPIRDRLPSRRVPVVNYLLIAVNVMAFVWQMASLASGFPERLFMVKYALVPAHFMAHPIESIPSIFTSMFMHGGVGHIAGNMLFLWIFGDNVEDALGRFRYLGFYLLSGIAAALAQILIDPSSRVPMVGASGAIAGVLAAYVSLYPRAPVTVLNPIPILWIFFGLFFELPAWVVIAEFFIVNLWNGLGTLGTATSGVAFFAHLGGFVAGLILVRFFLPDRGRRDHDRWQGFRPSRRPAPRGYYYPPPPQHRPWDG
jgi:membrane associated rhomboid family serine protease